MSFNFLEFHKNGYQLEGVHPFAYHYFDVSSKIKRNMGLKGLAKYYVTHEVRMRNMLQCIKALYSYVKDDNDPYFNVELVTFNKIIQDPEEYINFSDKDLLSDFFYEIDDTRKYLMVPTIIGGWDNINSNDLMKTTINGLIKASSPSVTPNTDLVERTIKILEARFDTIRKIITDRKGNFSGYLEKDISVKMIELTKRFIEIRKIKETANRIFLMMNYPRVSSDEECLNMTAQIMKDCKHKVADSWVLENGGLWIFEKLNDLFTPLLDDLDKEASFSTSTKRLLPNDLKNIVFTFSGDKKENVTQKMKDKERLMNEEFINEMLLDDAKELQLSKENKMKEEQLQRIAYQTKNLRGEKDKQTRALFDKMYSHYYVKNKPPNNNNNSNSSNNMDSEKTDGIMKALRKIRISKFK